MITLIFTYLRSLFPEPLLLRFISPLLELTSVRIRISDSLFRFDNRDSPDTPSPVSIPISPFSLPAKKNSIRDQTTFSVYRQISVTLMNLYHWNWNHRCSARWHPNRCYYKRYPKWVRWERPYFQLVFSDTKSNIKSLLPGWLLPPSVFMLSLSFECKRFKWPIYGKRRINLANSPIKKFPLVKLLSLVTITGFTCLMNGSTNTIIWCLI